MFCRCVGGQERFPPRLVIFVKLQSLLQWLEVFYFGGSREVNRTLRHFLRVGEIAGLSAGHAEHIQHERLDASRQDVGLGGEFERGFPVTNLWMVIGGQHVGGVGKNLKTVLVEPQRGAKLINCPGIMALFEQQLPQSNMRCRIVGVEPYGFGELAHGFVGTAEITQHGAEGDAQG